MVANFVTHIEVPVIKNRSVLVILSALKPSTIDKMDKNLEIALPSVVLQV